MTDVSNELSQVPLGLLKLNDDAISLVKKLVNQKDHENYYELISIHLKKDSIAFFDNLKNAIDILNVWIDKPNTFTLAPIKINARKKYIEMLENTKKYYNISINIIKNVTKNESLLHNLLFLKEYNFTLIFTNPTVPHIRKQIDFLQEYPFDSIDDKLQLGLSIGSARFDSPEQALQALCAYIERTTPDCIKHEKTNVKKNIAEIGYIKQIITLDTVIFSLKISFKNSKGINSYIYSDSSKIIHVLTNGNPPKKSLQKKLHILDINKYNLLLKFQEVIKKRLYYLIGLNNNVISFPYRVIDCVRLEPPCNNKNIISKIDVWNNLFQCYSCKIDLCANGCGKLYHGIVPCDMSIDEATELEIKNNTKQCPGCIINDRITNVYKFEGCNHITCTICTSEFCYKCGYKFVLNQYDKYDEDVTNHYSSGCLQFEN
jgi:hypothetical protein